VLGFVLRNNDDLQRRIVDSALGNFPVIGSNLAGSGAIRGNGFALAFGVLAALWAGLGAVYAAQAAIDTIWSVPRTKRANFLVKRVRALVILGVLGVGVLATTALAGIGTSLSAIPGAGRIISVIGTVVLNVLVLGFAYRLLTTASTTVRAVLPGAVFAGVGFALLQGLGSWYLTRVLAKANNTYGAFGAVIGLLTWIALQGRVFLYGAELNVVLRRHLWPRSLYGDAHTDADLRAEADRVSRVRT
jgi:membrane protein